jgi:hypothetical protein
MRFGDNMRDVAVTEGDKIEAQKKFGWEVNTWPVGDLDAYMENVTDKDVDALMDTYRASYDFNTDNIDAIRYQAREEIGMRRMLDAEGCGAFTNTFQDLYGMRQLPGLATQHLLSQGYGYGAEGDWKSQCHDRRDEEDGVEGERQFGVSWRCTPTISPRGRNTVWAPTCWKFVRPSPRVDPCGGASAWDRWKGRSRTSGVRRQGGEGGVRLFD